MASDINTVEGVKALFAEAVKKFGELRAQLTRFGFRPEASSGLEADLPFPFISLLNASEGRVDMVFNNAGQGSPAVPVEEVPIETFDKVISIDVRAAFVITQEAVRQMKLQVPQGGRIIS